MHDQTMIEKLEHELEQARRRERNELAEAAIYGRTAANVLALRERAYAEPKQAQQLLSLAQLDVALAELELEEVRRTRWADEAREEQRDIEARLERYRGQEDASTKLEQADGMTTPPQDEQPS